MHMHEDIHDCHPFRLLPRSTGPRSMVSLVSISPPSLLPGPSVASGDASGPPPSSTASTFFPCAAPCSTTEHRLAQLSCARRSWSVALAAVIAVSALPAQARDRRSKKEIPLDDYKTSGEGLKFYDFLKGKGGMVEKGQTILVHFDCMYRGIDAVSSRESKLLGGNRIIAQPYELIVGSVPGKERKREFVEYANGLFSAQASPKPPPALYSITEGMRVGGKRTVIVPPELGYGNKGSNEIPPGATFQLDIELLEIKDTAPS